jgi:hypothetical protein
MMECIPYLVQAGITPGDAQALRRIAMTLHLLLQDAKSLIDIVVANENLQWRFLPLSSPRKRARAPVRTPTPSAQCEESGARGSRRTDSNLRACGRKSRTVAQPHRRQSFIMSGNCAASPCYWRHRGHATALERAGINSLREGQKVTFDTQNDPRSGKIAVGVIALA